MSDVVNAVVAVITAAFANGPTRSRRGPWSYWQERLEIFSPAQKSAI